MAAVFLTAAAAVALYMTSIFILALILQDNSIADIAYGGAFIIAVGAALAAGGGAGNRGILLSGMVTVWGLRLILHLFYRKRGRGEDFRYRKWREEWGRTFVLRTFLQVFMLQGAVVIAVASPAIRAVAVRGNAMGVLEAAGIAVWAFGLAFEAVGDWQLLQFKKDPANKGKIITTGLWRYTRHPNYFGECTLWWGVFMVGLGTPGGWWTVISPLTINFLLLYVSGIPMLEKKYEGNPAFEEYRKRTSPLIPWFPKG